MFSFKKLAFVLLIPALFLNACGSSAAPAAVSSNSSAPSAFEQPAQTSGNDSSIVAVYWDEETQTVHDAIVREFQNENQQSGLTPEELAVYYDAHNPASFSEMTSEQKVLLASAGGLVLVGSTSLAGTYTVGSSTVTLVEAGSSTFPSLAAFLPAMEISPLVMVLLGSSVALKYTTTEAYASKMALMQSPLPENVKILVPSFAGSTSQLVLTPPNVIPPTFGISYSETTATINGQTLYLPIKGKGWSVSHTLPSGMVITITIAATANGKCKGTAFTSFSTKDMQNPLEGRFTADEESDSKYGCDEIDKLQQMARLIGEIAKKIGIHATWLGQAAKAISDFDPGGKMDMFTKTYGEMLALENGTWWLVNELMKEMLRH